MSKPTISSMPFAALLPIVLAAGLMACNKSPTPPDPTTTTPSATSTTTSPALETLPESTTPKPVEPMAAETTASSTAPGSTMAGDTAGAPTVVTLNLISATGIGADAGTVSLMDTPKGLSLKTNLKGLPPGEHGFHVHQNPDCNAAPKDGKPTAGEAAGEHYDPTHQGKHAGPDGMGHEGDLPRLTVSPDGTASITLTAEKLKVADVKNRSLMIHAGRDDYAAAPGGERIACGVIR